MSTATAQAWDTPGLAPAPQQIAGVLVVDLDRRRAHYECYRHRCPKPHEVPVKPSAIRAFVDGIKARHLSQYHGEQR